MALKAKVVGQELLRPASDRVVVPVVHAAVVWFVVLVMCWCPCYFNATQLAMCVCVNYTEAVATFACRCFIYI
jgi:hypothetical protein